MTAIQLLTKAIQVRRTTSVSCAILKMNFFPTQYELSGRKLESLKLYEEGIAELLKACKAESDPTKKQHFQKKIKEYMDQAEKLKEFIQNWGSRGEIRDRFHIADGATNHGYDNVFGNYLNAEVTEILIEEPYMKDHYHLCNLIMFCELAVTKCRNLKCIKVTTNKDKSPNSEQEQGLKHIAESLAKQNVNLYTDLTANLHDRQVMLSNGYIIKIGRGMNYFKPLATKLSLGIYNFNFRECRETNVDIFYCPENYQANNK